ncbi:hypothetical protein [Treponema brennaborense]|uniref:Uncharacterized protein n=1 Tax=Treponema brennaborense (strain DSM 12168 / CIP 105900 / DD5/3) TaxID=906968 RepID=F4LNF4_TREBD|nr:hypothetical protein [Treponema brennaborense]AEE17912.1 hypothetical protein Trebr_2506 [Treponema brennaborense DSM 12168]
MKKNSVCPLFLQNPEEKERIDWDYFVSEIQKVFKLNDFEVTRLKNSNVAKIIATIPFAAGCNEPERTAISHLITYIAEIKGFQKYCAHLPCDNFDIYHRLNRLATFSGGDKKIIHEGLSLLALIMLEGYHESQEHDKQNKIYNPLNSGSWNYEQKKAELEKELEVITCESLADFFTIGVSNGRW